MIPRNINRIVTLISKILAFGFGFGFGLIVLSACSSPTQIVTSPQLILNQPQSLVLFPKDLIEESADSSDGTEASSSEEEESASGEETDTVGLIGYVLNQNQGNGKIVGLSLTSSSEGISYLPLSIDIPEEEGGGVTNEIAIGGILEDATIDTQLKLGYVITSSPPALHLIDLKTHRIVPFNRITPEKTQTLHFLTLPGTPSGIGVISSPETEKSSPTSLLYIANQEHGEVLVFEVERNKTDIFVSGGLRDVTLNGGLASVFSVKGQPGRIRSFPGKDPLHQRLYITNRSQSLMTFVEEQFAPALRQRSVIDIRLLTASRDIFFSHDFARAFVIPYGSHQISILDQSKETPELMREKVTLCSLPLSGVATTTETTTETETTITDTLIVTTDQNQAVLVKVDRNTTLPDGSDSVEMLLPEVRCDLACNESTLSDPIALKAENNIIAADPICPRFCDSGVHSGPRIDWVVLQTCLTPTQDWFFVYGKDTDVNGDVTGSYAVYNGSRGSDTLSAQSARIREISPQQIKENPNGGFYSTKFGELKTRIIFEPSPSGESNTTAGERPSDPSDFFIFTTFSGFRATEVGQLPVYITSDPDNRFGMTVNYSSNTVLVIQLTNLEHILEIR